MEKNKIGNRVFSTISLVVFLSQEVHAQAEWQPAVGAALMIAVFLIALAYMIVHLMKLEQIKPLLKDEVGQIITTALIVGLVILSAQTFDDILKSAAYASVNAPGICPADSEFAYEQIYCKTMGAGYTPKENKDIREWALEINEKGADNLEQKVKFFTRFINRVGEQSSHSAMCNQVGTGFTLAGCSSWGVLRTPASQLLNAIGFAVMNLQAERILLSVGSTAAMTMLLPLGVLLRSLYFTRQAGSAIIALALSLYFVFPTMVVIGSAVSDATIRIPKIEYNVEKYECDAYNPELGELRSQMNSIIGKKDRKLLSEVSFGDKQMYSLDERIILMVLGRYLLMTALALTATLATARGLAKVLGAEINVMSIARLS